MTLGREGLVRVSENAVLSANYIRVKLALYFDQQYPGYCMHECVFSATRQTEKGVHALDIAKALIDRGIHPPTIYFPMIVKEAIMIEPTETESKEDIDKFIQVMIEIAKLADGNPDEIKKCPMTMPIRRLDETQAARKLDLASLE
jgi:glycine dehydrogenase subunit 2